MMGDLRKYITENAIRGACTCGKCIDAPENPEEHQPTEHTADVHFFKVSLRNSPDKEELKRLIQEQSGEFAEVNLFDGKEHSYIEIGAWIGDQGAALTLMGMGKLLDLWNLLTPESMMPSMPKELKNRMAGSGMISIVTDS